MQLTRSIEGFGSTRLVYDRSTRQHADLRRCLSVRWWVVERECLRVVERALIVQPNDSVFYRLQRRQLLGLYPAVERKMLIGSSDLRHPDSPLILRRLPREQLASPAVVVSRVRSRTLWSWRVVAQLASLELVAVPLTPASS